jgi:hypothetical protein
MRQSCFQFFFSLHNASVYGPKRMESGGEAQRARSIENDTIVDGSSGPSNIFISGATGPNAALINGHYVPTQETGLDGRILYLKSDFDMNYDEESFFDGRDASVDHAKGLMCIEHRSGDWEVKHVSQRGTALCYACFKNGSSLETCTSRLWRAVWIDQMDQIDQMEWRDDRNIKLVSGEKAMKAVKCPNFKSGIVIAVAT